MWPDPPAVMPESSGLDPGGEAVADCSRSNQIGGTCEAKGSVSDEREEGLIAGGGRPIHQGGTGGTPCGARSVKGEVSTWTEPRTHNSRAVPGVALVCRAI